MILSPRPALVVFDLAGTTVRDDGQVPASFTAALAEHGIDVTPEQIARVRGSSKRDAIRGFVPEGPSHARRVEEAYASFQAGLRERYESGGVAAIDGAEQTFAWLRAREVRIALNTGFDRTITGLLLAALGWSSGVADAVVCGDDVAQGRPAPDLIFRAMELCGVADAGRVANIGDTVLDLQAGHRASVRFNVGVLSGAHARAALEATPHTHILRDVGELPALLGST
ncbi:MAG: phosphonatase-like hydrolase [Vicinamibacteria bacterium]